MCSAVNLPAYPHGQPATIARRVSSQWLAFRGRGRPLLFGRCSDALVPHQCRAPSPALPLLQRYNYAALSGRRFDIGEDFSHDLQGLLLRPTVFLKDDLNARVLVGKGDHAVGILIRWVPHPGVGSEGTVRGLRTSGNCAGPGNENHSPSVLLIRNSRSISTRLKHIQAIE